MGLLTGCVIAVFFSVVLIFFYRFVVVVFLVVFFVVVAVFVVGGFVILFVLSLTQPQRPSRSSFYCFAVSLTVPTTGTLMYQTVTRNTSWLKMQIWNPKSASQLGRKGGFKLE